MKFKKLLVLGALLLVGSGVANAEVKDGVRVQPQPAKTQGFVASETTDTYYYLYNVKGQRFFTEGNAWGTQASVGYTGLKVAFTVDKEFTSAYLFNDYSLAKNSWKLVFFDSKTAMFVDHNSQANYRWSVVPGEGTFRLQAANADNGNPGWTEPAFEEGKFVGWDISNGTALSPYLEEGENHYIDWAFVSPEDYEAIADKLSQYEASIPLKEQLDKAKAMGADVSAYEAVYLNEASTIEEINTAIEGVKEAIKIREKEIAEQGINNATAENPVDVSSYIVNPDFAGDDLKTGWSGTGWGSYNPKENAERYQTLFDTYQDIAGLPEGVYALGVNAFFRAGNASPAYANFKANNAASKYLKLYAKSGDNEYKTAICSPFKGAPTAQQNQGSESSVEDGDVTYWIPNNMVAAEYYMHTLGLYSNKLFFGLDNETLRIGAKRLESDGDLIGGEWGIFDDFSLTYYGKGADAYQLWLNEMLKDYSDLTIPEGAIYTEQYKTAYEEVMASEKTATNAEEVKAVLADVAAAYDALTLNIDLWKQYQALIVEAKSVAADINLDPNYTEQLADWSEFDGPEAVAALLLTNAELEAQITEITAKVDEARKHPIGSNTDMTNLLKNPDFSKGTEGWTIEKASGGNVATGGTATNTCFEAWNNSLFDIYQEVENAPAGVYEISVQGFYRYGRTAYNDYLAQQVPEVKNAPVYIYLNDNMTSFTNVYGDPKQITDEEFYKSGSTDYVSETGADEVVYYYPNGMASAAIAFSDGMYTQAAYGLVAQAGDKMRIGVKGSSNQLGDSWSIWDNFRLVYKGYDADVIKPILEANIEKSEKTLQSPTGKDVADKLRAAINEAKKAVEDGDGTAMFKALSDLFAVGDAIRTSQAIFADLEKSYEKLATAIQEYGTTADINVYQSAIELQKEINDNAIGIEAAAITWTDEKAQTKIAEIEQMIKDLAKPAGYADATDNDPKDANWCIVNPKYSENTNEGWTSTANTGVNYNTCEVFDSDFNYYQDIELTAGTYELTAPGFYRFGSAAEDYNAFTEDPTQNNNLSMYVTVGEDSIAVAMPRLASAAHEYTADVTEATDGKKSFNAKNGYLWVADPVANADSTQATGYIVANNMEQAANEFASGYYGGTTITFKVPEDMKVRIGMTKNVQQTNNWSIWGAWQLTYFGKNSAKTVTPSGINAAFSNGQVARSEFFNLNGARISAPRSGVMIIKQTMADGTVKVRKVVVK